MAPIEAMRRSTKDDAEGFHPRCSTDSCSSSSSTDIDSSYTDLVLIHRGRWVGTGKDGKKGMSCSRSSQPFALNSAAFRQPEAAAAGTGTFPVCWGM